MNRVPRKKFLQIEFFEPMLLMSASGSELSGTDGYDDLIAIGGQTVFAGDGGDTITGAAGENCLFGEGGDDYFLSLKGGNVIDGGSGTDVADYTGKDRADFSVISLGDGSIEIRDGLIKDRITNVELFRFRDQDVAFDDLVHDLSNSAPVISAPDALESAAGQFGVIQLQTSDADNDSLEYRIAEEGDGVRFHVTQQGYLSFVVMTSLDNTYDQNGDNVYDVTIAVSDGSTSTLKTISVAVVSEVTTTNSAPVFNAPEGGYAFTAFENSQFGFTVGATDAEQDPISYSIAGGSDADQFFLGTRDGQGNFSINFLSPPDFENPSDSDNDNEYNLILRASDGQLSTDVAVSISVQNAPESGEIIEVPEFTVPVIPSNGAMGSTGGISLAGADASLFRVDGITGELSFLLPPDFRFPQDQDFDNDYELIYREFSPVGSTTETNITVRVVDALFNSNNFGAVRAGARLTIEENTADVVTAGSLFRFSTGPLEIHGPDGDLFEFDSETRTVQFIDSPDFERPHDGRGDNEYEIVVRLDGFETTADVPLTVRVVDINDDGGNSTPYFSSERDGVVTVDLPFEFSHTTLDPRIKVIDPDGDDLSYTIIGGPDASLFEAEGFSFPFSTGVNLRPNVTLDPNQPADSDGDNVYEVTLRASDGQAEADTDVRVVVTDRLDADGDGFALVEVAENEARVLEPDGALRNFGSLQLTGPDADRFTFDRFTGRMQFTVAPDFENPQDADGDNDYEVTYRRQNTVSGTFFDTDMTVRVTDESKGGNQPPTFLNLLNGEAIFVNENTTAVRDIDAVDPEGAEVNYFFLDSLGFAGSGSNEDVSAFILDLNTGELSFKNSPDFEAPADADANNEYLVTVVANDGEHFVDRDVRVVVVDTVEAPNAAPEFTNITNGEIKVVSENDTLVSVVSGTDPDGDDVSFSISGGADAALFSVDSVSGELSFLNPADYESPDDADFDNKYQVTLRISDGQTHQDADLTVRVVDGIDNQRPQFTNVMQTELIEVVSGDRLVRDVDSADSEGDTVTYTIIGGTDASLFSIDSVSGVVEFINAPDVNDPLDDDRVNEYELRLQVSDGELFEIRDVTIRVVPSPVDPVAAH